MNTHRAPAIRRGWALLLLTALSAVALPVSAACNGNPNARVAPANGQTVAETTNGVPTAVQLSGLASTPNNGDLLFAWQYLGSVPTGYNASLSGANTATPTFASPNVAPAGASLQFRLTVTCGAKTDTTTTTVNVTDVAVVSNTAPTAIGTVSPGSAHEGETVTLDGTASYDLDAGTTLSYQWAQIGGSPTMSLANVTANGSKVAFVAPNIAVTSSLTFRLTVSDGSLQGSTDKIVNILWTNDPPVASLVCPNGVFVVDEGAPVALNGSGSSDSDGTIMSYVWEQVSGVPNLDLAGQSASTLAFNAPHLGYGQLGSLSLRLTVTDNNTASSSTECGVFIKDVSAPGISTPGDITAEADSTFGATVGYSAYAQDAVDDSAPYLLTCAPPAGSVFPLAAAPANDKTTAVACAATDSAGNTANASFNITVHDTTAPVITAPLGLGVEAMGASGATAEFPATTADVVDGAGTATCVPASGSLFPLGDTSVSCNAADARGNAATPRSFVLTVHDTTRPTIDPRGDVTQEATGASGALVTYASPTTHDLVDGDRSATCTPASGALFALGATVVTCSAVDAAGNAAIDTYFNVTVLDRTPPTIDAHDDVTEEATSAAGAVVTYTSPATQDLVDGVGVASCLPASGTTFALGTTLVTCSASDNAGNAANDTHFNVTVVDRTPPTIDAVSDIGPVEAAGPLGTLVFYTSPATHDAVDGDGTATCSPTSASIFAIAATTVTCTAHDAAGNEAASRQFVVTVVDSTPPTIDAHPNIDNVEATGPAGATVNFTNPATHDAVDGDGISSCAPASGSTFAIGPTTVTCSAHDAANNEATAQQFVVTVVDTTAPSVTPPANVTAEATGPLTAVTHGSATASDAVGVVSLTNDAPATFPLGTTMITWTAADAAGNSASATSTVTVVDTTAPAVTVPASILREATSAAGASVSFSATAIDLVYGNVAVTCTPASGSTFALGATTVACAATDGSGNTGQAAFTVTVQDTTAPVIHYLGDVNATAGSNSSAAVNYPQPTAWDIVDGTVPVNCTPASGSTFPVGTNTVNCSATDQHGNTGSGSFKVTVSYAWTGFFRPVDMAPIVNSSKAGSAIPLKFSLGGNQGMGIMAAGYPKSAPMSCGGALEDPLLETVTAGASSLQYDAGASQYIYVWKSEKSWAGTCRQIQVKLADGTLHTANFAFK
jgi:hypothetical protein